MSKYPNNLKLNFGDIFYLNNPANPIDIILFSQSIEKYNVILLIKIILLKIIFFYKKVL